MTKNPDREPAEKAHRLPEQGRLLAVDFGERRMGISITDELQITAQAKETLTVDRPEEAIAAIEKLVQECQIKGILIGLPLTMSGEEGPMSAKVREFAQQLKQTLSIPVVLWDERLTSLQAERTLREFNKKPSRHKAEIDRLAATFLLRNYLDSRRK